MPAIFRRSDEPPEDSPAVDVPAVPALRPVDPVRDHVPSLENTRLARRTFSCITLQ